MNEQRKQEIKEQLQTIIHNFKPTEDIPELTTFELISQYNQKYDNKELIGGSWAKKNGFQLK